MNKFVCKDCLWYHAGCPDLLFDANDHSCPYADKENCGTCDYLESCLHCRRGCCCECPKEQFDLCMACRDR